MERKPAAVFDIDGTVYRSNLVVELTHTLVRQGTFPETALESFEKSAAQWKLERTRESFQDYINQVVAAYIDNIRGVQTLSVRRAVDEILRFSNGLTYVYTRGLIANLQQSHFLVAISAAPREAVAPIARRLGFQACSGSIFEVENDIYTGAAIPGGIGKDKILLDFVERLGLTLEGSMGVGDTDSDIPMLNLVEQPIAFNPNKELLQHAINHNWKVVLELKDNILHLQGGRVELVDNFGHFYN